MAQHPWHDFSPPNQNIRLMPERLGQNLDNLRSMYSGAAEPTETWDYQIFASEAVTPTVIRIRNKGDTEFIDGPSVIHDWGLIHWRNVEDATVPASAPTSWDKVILFSDGVDEIRIPGTTGAAW